MARSRPAERGGIAQPRCGVAASSTYLEQARPLTAPARRLLAPPQVALLLPLGDVGQNRPQPLVLHHRRLVHPLALVKGPIGKLQALVLDRKSTVGIVEHRDALTGEGPCDVVWLKDEQHVVILQRQAVGDRALLLPGERLVNLVMLAQKPVQILVRARLLGEAAIVVLHERRQELVASLDRG